MKCKGSILEHKRLAKKEGITFAAHIKKYHPEMLDDEKPPALIQWLLERANEPPPN